MCFRDRLIIRDLVYSILNFFPWIFYQHDRFVLRWWKDTFSFSQFGLEGKWFFFPEKEFRMAISPCMFRCFMMGARASSFIPFCALFPNASSAEDRLETLPNECTARPPRALVWGSLFSCPCRKVPGTEPLLHARPSFKCFIYSKETSQ